MMVSAISVVSPELLANIFEKLDTKSLVQATRVCTLWHKVINYESVLQDRVIFNKLRKNNVLRWYLSNPSDDAHQMSFLKVKLKSELTIFNSSCELKGIKKEIEEGGLKDSEENSVQLGDFNLIAFPFLKKTFVVEMTKQGLQLIQEVDLHLRACGRSFQYDGVITYVSCSGEHIATLSYNNSVQSQEIEVRSLESNEVVFKKSVHNSRVLLEDNILVYSTTSYETGDAVIEAFDINTKREFERIGDSVASPTSLLFLRKNSEQQHVVYYNHPDKLVCARNIESKDVLFSTSSRIHGSLIAVVDSVIYTHHTEDFEDVIFAYDADTGRFIREYSSKESQGIHLESVTIEDGLLCVIIDVEKSFYDNTYNRCHKIIVWDTDTGTIQKSMAWSTDQENITRIHRSGRMLFIFSDSDNYLNQDKSYLKIVDLETEKVIFASDKIFSLSRSQGDHAIMSSFLGEIYLENNSLFINAAGKLARLQCVEEQQFEKIQELWTRGQELRYQMKKEPELSLNGLSLHG